MEALDVFFNDGKGVIKLDKDDVNVDARGAEDREISIAICFCDCLNESSLTQLTKQLL